MKTKKTVSFKNQKKSLTSEMGRTKNRLLGD